MLPCWLCTLCIGQPSPALTVCLHCNATARSTPTNASCILSPPSASLQVGSDHIDLHAASQKGITVVEVSCGLQLQPQCGCVGIELRLLP